MFKAQVDNQVYRTSVCRRSNQGISRKISTWDKLQWLFPQLCLTWFWPQNVLALLGILRVLPDIPNIGGPSGWTWCSSALTCLTCSTVSSISGINITIAVYISTVETVSYPGELCGLNLFPGLCSNLSGIVWLNIKSRSYRRLSQEVTNKMYIQDKLRWFSECIYTLSAVLKNMVTEFKFLLI